MPREKTIIKVGMADLNTVEAPDNIKTSGLGSCVGVVLYDLSKQVAGLAHIMLPDSRLAKRSPINRLKYADTAIPRLIENVNSAGGRKHALQAKIAGGAQMFDLALRHDLLQIGAKNTQAVQNVLTHYQITLKAADVGGSSGRIIEFDPAAGTMAIRTVYKGESVI